MPSFTDAASLDYRHAVHVHLLQRHPILSTTHRMTDLDTFTGSYVSVPSTHPADGVDIFVRRKGEGEGLLLLHGYPQTGRYVSDHLSSTLHLQSLNCWTCLAGLRDI